MNQIGQLRLVCAEGNACGSEIVVDAELMIGRRAPPFENLAGDEGLSRYHARVKRTEDGGYVIEDLLSTNGTFVNGSRIAGSFRVADGDQIRVGATTLVAHLLGPRSVADATSRRLTRFEIDFDSREVTVQLSDGPQLKLVEGPDGWRSADDPAADGEVNASTAAPMRGI